MAFEVKPLRVKYATYDRDTNACTRQAVIPVKYNDKVYAFAYLQVNNQKADLLSGIDLGYCTALKSGDTLYLVGQLLSTHWENYIDYQFKADKNTLVKEQMEEWSDGFKNDTFYFLDTTGNDGLITLAEFLIAEGGVLLKPVSLAFPKKLDASDKEKAIAALADITLFLTLDKRRRPSGYTKAEAFQEVWGKSAAIHAYHSLETFQNWFAEVWDGELALPLLFPEGELGLPIYPQAFIDAVIAAIPAKKGNSGGGWGGKGGNTSVTVNTPLTVDNPSEIASKVLGLLEDPKFQELAKIYASSPEQVELALKLIFAKA